MYFSEFVQIWLSKHVDTELSEKTKLNYRHHIHRRIKPFFGHMRMGQIKTMQINDFLESLRELLPGEKPIGQSTIMYAYRVLRSIFKYATEWRVIPDNPIVGVKKPKEGERGEIQVYDERELEQLFNALENEPLRTRCIIMLAVTCGMRRAEIAGLEWKHVDLEARTVEIRQSIPMNKDGQPVIKSPKTRKSVRKIAMPVLVVEQLHAFKHEWELERKYAKLCWLGRGEFLFCHESGQPHDPHWITDLWIDFRTRHKLKSIRFHDLRHTAATWMIKANVHPKAIANRLGHVNIKTTMDVYSHVLESVDRAAADVFNDMPSDAIRRGALVSPQLN